MKNLSFNLNLLALLPAIVIAVEAVKRGSIVGVLISSGLFFMGMWVMNLELEPISWRSFKIGHLAAVNAFFFLHVGAMYGWIWALPTPFFLALVTYFYNEVGKAVADTDHSVWQKGSGKQGK